MITVRRGQLINGHMVEALARDFVCAECGSGLVVDHLENDSQVACSQDEQHTGMMSHLEWRAQRAIRFDIEAEERKRQLQQIQIPPEVKQVVDARRAQTRRVLFED